MPNKKGLEWKGAERKYSRLVCEEDQTVRGRVVEGGCSTTLFCRSLPGGGGGGGLLPWSRSLTRDVSGLEHRGFTSPGTRTMMEMNME